MLSPRIAIVVLSVTGMVALAGSLPGVVAKPRIPSDISLNGEPDGFDFVFSGRVTSDERKCKRWRKVTITANNFKGSEPVVEGVVRTNRRGRYELRVKAATNTIGGYRARASRKVKPDFICKAARSEIVGP